MSRKKGKVETSGGEDLFQQAFAELPLSGDGLPDGPGEVAKKDGEKKAKASGKSSKRFVLRREKKGRGGKTVTVLEARDHSFLPELDQLVLLLKKKLGKGGQREGRQIVLQGEPDDRLPQILEEQGFRL